MSVLFGFALNVISSIRRSINIGISTSIAVSTMHNRQYEHVFNIRRNISIHTSIGITESIRIRKRYL